MRPIRELLAEIAADKSANEFAAHAYGGLSGDEIRELASAGMPTYTGKVRDVVQAGDELLIVHSDRLTAFDKLIAMVPYKGTILTAISDYWLSEARAVVPTHLLGRPHERVLRVERAQPVKIEVIVRGYLAGSMQRAYEAGEREFCGERLPAGLTPYVQLPRHLITPTTKAAAFEHDENTDPAALIAAGVCTGAEWAEISAMALALFAHGQQVLGRVGWLLVDTKYEFGRTLDGRLKVIDEIHTPDSSRFWVASSYAARVGRGDAPEMLDKEVVRRYLIKQGFSGEGAVPAVPHEVLLALADTYLTVAETLTGRPLYTAGPRQVVDVRALR